MSRRALGYEGPGYIPVASFRTARFSARHLIRVVLRR